MAKNLLICCLLGLSITLWIWPRFGMPLETSDVEVIPATGVADSVEEHEPSPFETLPSLMQAMQRAPGFEAALLGLSVFAGAEEPVVGYRDTEAMTPASTLKAVTSATAMTLLGPDFEYETQLSTSKPWELGEDGRFEGDLILIGSGDPMLTSHTLETWALELKGKGLKKVLGRVLADARCFPEQVIPNAWDWGDVSNYYGAGPSGLNLDFNRFEVTFKPNTILDQPAVISAMEPPLDWIKRFNFTTTAEAGSGSWTSIYGGPYANGLTFRGRIPQGEEAISARGAVPDSAFHAAERFTALLGKVGIEAVGKPNTMRRLTIAGEALPEATGVLLSHQSEPLTSIIRYLHRTSDNMATECLYQKLIEKDPLGRVGVDIVKMHWEKQGLSFRGLRMEDGSGLARADAIRPRDLAEVLWRMRRSPLGEVFSGTLNQNHGGRMRWKGGAMSRVRAYTGHSENGYTFALMINQYEASAKDLAAWRARIMDAILALPPAGAESS